MTLIEDLLHHKAQLCSRLAAFQADPDNPGGLAEGPSSSCSWSSVVKVKGQISIPLFDPGCHLPLENSLTELADSTSQPASPVAVVGAGAFLPTRKRPASHSSASSSPITNRIKRLQVDLTNSTSPPRRPSVAPLPSSVHCEGHSLTSSFTEVPPVADVVSDTDDLRHWNLTIYDGGCLNGQPGILVIGNSITRSIQIPCGITYCFSGCKVSNVSLHIPALLDRYPTVHTVTVHVGNEVMSRQSIKLQSNFESLTLTL